MKGARASAIPQQRKQVRPTVPNPIHATNAWNPTGRNLLPVEGTRLFYAHAETLSGSRTFVLLGDQHHLTFVADLEDHVDPSSLRSVLIERYGLYPHLVDLEPAAGLPRVFKDQRQDQASAGGDAASSPRKSGAGSW
jgi:hypothetical protein